MARVFNLCNIADTSSDLCNCYVEYVCRIWDKGILALASFTSFYKSKNLFKPLAFNNNKTGGSYGKE